MRSGGPTAWVKVTPGVSCESCAAKGSCHERAGDREVEAINAVGAKAGDKVMVVTDTGPYLKMTFVLYIVPVLALLAGVAVGSSVAGRFGWDQSLCAVVAGLIAVIPAVFFVRYQGGRMAGDNRYRPRINRILVR